MKSYTIALDGSTYRGTVALLRDSELVAERTLGADDGGVQRSGKGESLMPAIAECIAEVGVKRADISAIVCGSGPGSFTSLRVAGSVAKGLAVGYGVPLYSVPSLLLTVAGAAPRLGPGDYLSVLDAMRAELYAARVGVDAGGIASQIGPTMLLSATALDDLRRANRGVRVAGPGQDIDIGPHARGVAAVFDSILAGRAVDLASWEPDYGRLAEAQVRWEAEHGRPLAL
jgi:tRNA threonylcarbamoyladenosine biosynthesis protein TsaB